MAMRHGSGSSRGGACGGDSSQQDRAPQQPGSVRSTSYSPDSSRTSSASDTVGTLSLRGGAREVSDSDDVDPSAWPVGGPPCSSGVAQAPAAAADAQQHRSSEAAAELAAAAQTNTTMRRSAEDRRSGQVSGLGVICEDRATSAGSLASGARAGSTRISEAVTPEALAAGAQALQQDGQ
jgi:hypothetical protein